MCGIFGYIGKKNNAADLVFTGLKNLEYRGYDSYGILAKKQDGMPFLLKKTGPLPPKKPPFPASTFAFGHTRWATHGGVTVVNAHPHFDCQKNVFVVHNGIVENFELLKKQLIAAGHRFISATDTEIIVHLIEEKRKTLEFVEAVRQAFLALDGFNAVIAAELVSETFVGVKNISPIAIGKKNGDFYFASDPNVLADFSGMIHFLEDNTLAVIKKSGLNLYQTMTKQPLSLHFRRYKPVVFKEKKNTFPHLMIKEIFEEPYVIERILTHPDGVKELATAIRQSYGAYCIGAGSAAYAGLFGTYIFSKIARRHLNFAFASEFAYFKDFLTKKSLVIALSQSGETADVIAAVKSAQEKGTAIAAVTNVFGSTLYRMSQTKLLLGAGPEKAVLATKSFTAKLTVLLLLAAFLNDETNMTLQLRRAAGELVKMKKPRYQQKLKTIVTGFYKKNRLFVIGRGANYPLALEAALKIKEGSYLHAEALAGGELKHGVIALVEKGTPCLVIAPNDETYADIISNAMELKSRGGRIIGVGSKKSSVFDAFVPIGDIGAGSYLLLTFVIQLLGYYTAVLRGVNPDRPRNLAKSVTVK